jgi:hypothetical protein
MISDYSFGWGVLQCTELAIPNIDGRGSPFMAGDEYKMDYKWL